MVDMKLKLLFKLVGFLSLLSISFTAVAQNLVEIPEKGLSIVLPSDWQIEKNVNGATILAQSPENQDDSYRRNIRVMSFKGSRYIDQVSLEQFAKEIEDNSAKMSNQVSSYRVRDMTMIELADQTRAGLFYADFFLGGIAMMQMRILVSSQDHHFLLTFTDIQENFESSSNGYLDEAYQAFLSVKLASEAPGRSDLLFKVLPIGIGLVFLIGAFSFFRSYQIKRLSRGVKEYEDDELGEPDEKDRIDDLSFSDSDVFSAKKSLNNAKIFKKAVDDDVVEEASEFDVEDDNWKLGG